MPEPVVLKSSAMGSVMKALFWYCAVYAGALLVLAVAVQSDPGGTVQYFALLGLGLFNLGLLPLAVITVVWVVLFHQDLHRVFPGYPMSPLRAVLYMFIPVFNLFGLWRTFASISEYLRASGGEAGRLGDRANLFATLGYVSIYVCNALYIFTMDLTVQPARGAVDPKVILAQTLASTLFVVFYLNSIRLSQQSLALRAEDGAAEDMSAEFSYMRA